MKKLLLIIFLILNVSLVYSQRTKNIQDSSFHRTNRPDTLPKATCNPDSLLMRTDYSYDSLRNDSTKRGELDSYISSNAMLIIVNNVVIRDSLTLSYFMNCQFDSKILRHRLWITFDRGISLSLPSMQIYSKEKAEKKGFSDVPKCGALVIKTKRRFYIDLKGHPNEQVEMESVTDAPKNGVSIIKAKREHFVFLNWL